jgi:hypothetical protein
MEKPDTLQVVFQLMDRLGTKAELFAGDEMERALERGSVDDFEEWRLIAETIAALGREGAKGGFKGQKLEDALKAVEGYAPSLVNLPTRLTR